MIRTAPTGVLLGNYQPGTPEWERARAGLCITATEIAAVLGLSPPNWQSRYSLWHKKAGLPGPPFVDTPAIEWGRRLEPAVFQKFADEHPEYHVMPTGTWQHKDRPWQRATPDRLLAHRAPGTGVIDLDHAVPAIIAEGKTSPIGDEWGPDGTDEVPIHYRCQVIWQQDTLGLHARTPVAVLIGGHDYRELYVDYDIDDAKVMREAAEEFLDTVRRGIRPDIDDAEATLQTVKRQPNGLEDVEVDIGPHLADRYRETREQETALAAKGRLVRALVLDRLGTAKYAASLGERLAYRTVRPDGTTHALQPVR